MEKKYLTADEIISIHSTCVEEREISFVKTAVDDVWSVYVSDNSMLTKIKRAMKQPGGERIKCWEAGRVDGFPTGYFFEMPAECISIRARKKTRKNPLTDEQRKAIGERFRAGRLAKQSIDEDDEED